MNTADRSFSRSRRPVRAQEVKSVNLALQGGGAHGAFAWGVLDRLLEENSVAFDGISATSAGAVNAVVLAYGLTKGGREGARQALREFWQQISDAALLSPLQPSVLDRLTGNRSLETSPIFLLFHMLTQVVSPYELNPFNSNPLLDVLERVVDFELLRCNPKVKLFLSATNVRSGKIRVFENHEMSSDVVLASTCLPFIFQAVRINEEYYWDGGYMGNPALFPLIYRCETSDIVMVHINPISRPTVPTTAAEILNRINEISFNSSLMREVRAVEFLNRLVDEGRAPTPEIRQVRLHAVEADEIMRHLGAASKLNADWNFLTDLYTIGRKKADAWLRDDFPKVGIRSSINICDKYL